MTTLAPISKQQLIEMSDAANERIIENTVRNIYNAIIDAANNGEYKYKYVTRDPKIHQLIFCIASKLHVLFPDVNMIPTENMPILDSDYSILFRWKIF